MNFLEIAYFTIFGVAMLVLCFFPADRMLNEVPKKKNVTTETGTISTVSVITKPTPEVPGFLDDNNLSL